MTINDDVLIKIKTKKFAAKLDYEDLKQRIDMFGCTSGGIQDADESFECGYYRALRDVLEWIGGQNTAYVQTMKCFTIIYNNGEINEYEEEEESERYFTTKKEAIAYLRSQEHEETITNGLETSHLIYRFTNDMLRCYHQVQPNNYGWEPPEDTCIVVDGIKYSCNGEGYEYIRETTLTMSDSLQQINQKGGQYDKL